VKTHLLVFTTIFTTLFCFLLRYRTQPPVQTTKTEPHVPSSTRNPRGTQETGGVTSDSFRLPCIQSGVRNT